MVHVVVDRNAVEPNDLVGVFTSLKKARTFADGYGRERYPKLPPAERPVHVVSKRVI